MALFQYPTTREERERERVEQAAEAERKREDQRWWNEFAAGVAEGEARVDAAKEKADLRRRFELLDFLDDMASDAAAKRDRHILDAWNLPPGNPKRAQLQRQARNVHERAKVWREIRQEAASQVHVRERSPYGPGSPHSYFADLMVFSTPTPVDGKAEATERMRRYARSVGLDAMGGEARARRALRDRSRKALDLRSASEVEWRAMTTGTTSGGAFLPPAHLTGRYAPWRSFVPAVANATTQVDLPAYGLEVMVPAVESGPDVVTAPTGENTGIVETDLVTGFRSVPVVTYAGSTRVSLQLLDRAGPTAFDQVIYDQLRKALDQKLDAAVITALLAGATTNVTRATYVNIGSLWSDVNQAAASLETADGTVLPATHLFMPPTSFRWFASQVDGQGRPIWMPDGDVAPNPANGFTGYRIASTGVYTDGSLPTSGANAQFVVANPASTLFLKGEPIVQVIPELYAGTLSALVRLYCYGTVVVRYPAAAATVSGAAYPASPAFA